LPYNKAEGTKSVTVLAVSVKLDVSPPLPWTAGQTVTFTATVMQDSNPMAGATVAFAIYPIAGGTRVIGSATTDSSGKATLTWTVPWSIGGVTLPCSSFTFWAVEQSSGVSSNKISGKIAYPTRISISAPDTVAQGQYFTISGKLEYQSASGVWSGLAGKTVSLYYNGTKITDVTTASDGSYSASATIPSSGTYTLKASYAGEGFALAPALALAEIKLAVPESVKPLITPLAAILVGGIVAIASTRKR